MAGGQRTADLFSCAEEGIGKVGVFFVSFFFSSFSRLILTLCSATMGAKILLVLRA